MQTPAGVLESSRGRSLPDADTCRELLRQMVLIRRFEEEAGRQYQRAKAGGFLQEGAEPRTAALLGCRGPAENAEFQPGDIIVAVNDTPVADAEAFSEQLHRGDLSGGIELSVIRGNLRGSLTIQR